MNDTVIPKLNPRIKEVSERFLHQSDAERAVRLKLLKQQLMNGTYRPNSLTLAKAIISNPH